MIKILAEGSGAILSSNYNNINFYNIYYFNTFKFKISILPKRITWKKRYIWNHSMKKLYNYYSK